MVKKVAIVGAGPAGILLAHYLLLRGDQYQIDIYERRSDKRTVSFSKSRTFPISLSERGMSALRQISGLEEAVKAISVEITGAIFHQKNGKTRVNPRKSPLFTLDRSSLVMVLLENLTQKYDNSRLNINFNCQCTQVDFASKKVRFEKIDAAIPTDFTVDYHLLIGADGSHSAVRKSFLATEFFECQQKPIRTDYKSLFLPRPDEKLGIYLEPGKIHTWRLDDGTILLLPYQLDGTMSGIIHFPRQKNQVDSLVTAQQVIQFFRKNFPAVGELMPESEAEAFANRLKSTVITVRCNRYHHGDSVMLLGDAAHAVSPSLGQGCNASLEDVVIFDNLLNEYSDNIATVIEQFTLRRKPDAHALVELDEGTFPLSTGLFIEFIFREGIAKTLHKIFPQNFSPSLFQLISETTTPYSEILNSHQGWISKVRKSEEKFVNPV